MRFLAALLIAAAAWVQPAPGTRSYQLNDARLTESSGIAPSRVREGVYYTHNDSGDSARFFAFKLTSSADVHVRSEGPPSLTLAVEYDLENVAAKDWEDIATAKLRGKSYVFCGDIGDNKSKRASIHVYRVPEPTGGGGKVRADMDIELTYPDGPHNAETLLVDPKSGRISIVAKTQDRGAGIYSLALPKKSGSYTLTRIGAVSIPAMLAPARLITGGAISADGKWVVLRTYVAAYEFPNKGDWWKSKPRLVELNGDPQGEGITYSPDGKCFLTTSEGRPCKVSVIPRQ